MDHKQIGMLYILLAVSWLFVGGFEATVIRLQLIRPGIHADRHAIAITHSLIVLVFFEVLLTFDNLYDFGMRAASVIPES